MEKNEPPRPEHAEQPTRRLHDLGDGCLDLVLAKEGVLLGGCLEATVAELAGSADELEADVL